MTVDQHYVKKFCFAKLKYKPNSLGMKLNVCVHVCCFIYSNIHLNPLLLNVAEEEVSGHLSVTFHVFITIVF